MFFPGVHLVADDTRYSEAAYKISQFQIQLPTNHHNARIGNTFSIAVFYALFGVNEYAAIGASLVYSLLNILLIFLFSREIFVRQDWFKIGSIGAVLFSFIPISVSLGASLLPLQGQAFFMLGAVYLLIRAEKERSSWYCLFSGLSIGISYLFHATGAYVLFAVFAYVLVKRMFKLRVVLVLAGFLLVVCCENGVYYAKTGKLLYRQTLAVDTRFDTTHTDTRLNATTVKKFKTIDNPFSGTFLGDSWALEPFRQLLLNPTHSIIYHLFFLASLILLIRSDKHLLPLSAIFWPMFLYYSYGTPTPFAYVPLRRLPRYILPCLIPVCITVGYGIVLLLKRKKYVRYALMLGFIGFSMLCSSVKGGEIGQMYHQSKFFYTFMQDHPGEQFITDSKTFLGFEFLSTYQELPSVQVIPYREFVPSITANIFANDHHGSYLFVTIPELYGQSPIELDKLGYTLLAHHERNPRKICYVPGIQQLLQNSLCDSSNGGKIYQVK